MYLTHSLYVPHSLYVSHSLCICNSLTLYMYLTLNMYLTHSQYVSHSLSLCICISLTLNMYLTHSVYVSHSLCICISLTQYIIYRTILHFFPFCRLLYTCISFFFESPLFTHNFLHSSLKALSAQGLHGDAIAEIHLVLAMQPPDVAEVTLVRDYSLHK